MAFSERHAARATGNAAIAGALLTFCGAAYWYTVMKVRKDEMDVAIERREAQGEGRRGRREDGAGTSGRRWRRRDGAARAGTRRRRASDVATAS